MHKARASGVALVEFALMVLLLLPVFFGIAELGRALLLEQQLVRSVEAGARYLARIHTGLDPANCGAIASALTSLPSPTTAVATAAELTVFGQESGGTTPLIAGMTTADPVISVNQRPIPGDADACVIRVAARVSYPSIFGGATIPFLSVNQPVLNAASEERYVGE